MGCDSSGFFSLFNGNSAQCGPVNNQIQQMRGNLDQINKVSRSCAAAATPSVTTSGAAYSPRWRRTIAARNYAAAARGGFFNDLFGNNQPPPPPTWARRRRPTKPSASAPATASISRFPTRRCQARFPDDERACKQLCPAAEAALYAFRYPGEDINQAVSISGQPYTALPNAFKYRQEFNSVVLVQGGRPELGRCVEADRRARRAAENGDIIVTDENAKKMMQPRDAQGRPVKQTPKGTGPAAQNAKNTPAQRPLLGRGRHRQPRTAATSRSARSARRLFRRSNCPVALDPLCHGRLEQMDARPSRVSEAHGDATPRFLRGDKPRRSIRVRAKE